MRTATVTTTETLRRIETLNLNSATESGTTTIPNRHPYNVQCSRNRSTDISSSMVPQGISRNQHAQQQQQRQRSLSVATAQPSVETVVVKAKRAASSLWMLLHAQNCTHAAGTCQHTGCQEAKLMHLHLKCCPAGAVDFACPTNYHGCDQARKLLAHYRRCKIVRSRQAGRRDVPGQQPHCLVCSLVARQARTALEQKLIATTGNGSSGSSPNSSLSTSGKKSVSSASKNGASSAVTSFRVGGKDDLILEPTLPRPPKDSCPSPGLSKKIMPPPPPRFGTMNSTTQGVPSSPPSFENAMGFSISGGPLSSPVRRDRAHSVSYVDLDCTAANDAYRGGPATTDDDPCLSRRRPRSCSVGCSPNTSTTSMCDTILEEESVGSKD